MIWHQKDYSIWLSPLFNISTALNVRKIKKDASIYMYVNKTVSNQCHRLNIILCCGKRSLFHQIRLQTFPWINKHVFFEEGFYWWSFIISITSLRITKQNIWIKLAKHSQHTIVLCWLFWIEISKLLTSTSNQHPLQKMWCFL